MKQPKIELLSPAGDMDKLKTALHFGADAVYFAGKNYGLRAMSSNFTNEQMVEAVNLVHSQGKKAYVTLNIFAHESDFEGLEDYIKFLNSINVDAVIVSDLGIFNLVRKTAPNLEIHVSTQANTTNKYSAKMFKELGATRVVLARELTINEIKAIHDFNKDLELEAFVHGAMCISYSGRCLLSNYLTGRDSNHGECVQACRWRYYVTEEKRPDQSMEIQEDQRGTYIFNSKDLCLIDYIDQIAQAGVTSFKVEGRMKSPYYVATVINTYRRAIDHYYKCLESGQKYQTPEQLKQELLKASHRDYTTGFMFNNGLIKQRIDSAAQEQSSKFIAIVKEVFDDKILVEQRNRFKVGDKLEILSPNSCFLKTLEIKKLYNKDMQPTDDAKDVCGLYYIETNIKNIAPHDILRA